MQVWFFFSLLGFIDTIPLYFLSLEHSKLEEKYGKAKGKRIGEIFGMVSGWGFFLFWFGIWLSPQERFAIPFLQDFSIHIPILNLTIYLINSLIFLPLFIAGAWFGIKGVTQTSLKVAETHRAERIATTGVYSIVRHPQYLGGILAHIGFSVFLSALYSLLATPLVIAVIYIISWKEETELTKEFGKDYADYQKRVPMIIPRLCDESSLESRMKHALLLMKKRNSFFPTLDVHDLQLVQANRKHQKPSSRICPLLPVSLLQNSKSHTTYVVQPSRKKFRVTNRIVTLRSQQQI